MTQDAPDGRFMLGGKVARHGVKEQRNRLLCQFLNIHYDLGWKVRMVNENKPPKED